MAAPIRRFASALKAAAFIHSAPVTIDATASVTRSANAGRTNLLSAAAGLTVTLPAATGSGSKYRFVVGTAAASGDYVIKVANATDVFCGGVLVNDIGDSSSATSDFQRTASTSDTITLAYATGGGKVGDFIEVEDIASGFFAVTGVIQGVSDPGTVFSASVG